MDLIQKLFATMHSLMSSYIHTCVHYRQVTTAKSKSGAVVKHQRVFVVLKTTSNAKWLFKSGAAPLYRSLVTSLHYTIISAMTLLFKGCDHTSIIAQHIGVS